MASERLWLDDSDTVNVKNRIRNSPYSDKLYDLWHDGIALLPGAVPTELCDAINNEYYKFCESTDGMSNVTLRNGARRRLCCFHMICEPAREAICQPSLAGFLDEVFERPFAICTSLYFEQSTEQPTHRDSPFFCTEPYGRYLGVWIALTDVQPEAGPLAYYPGAHRIEVDRLSGYRAIDDISASVNTYRNDLVNLAERAGIKECTVLPRKGDAVIWHPELPHGGSKILSPGAKRESMVFHVVPCGTPVFGPDVFFGLTPPPYTVETKLLDAGHGRFMQDGSRPFFDPTG